MKPWRACTGLALWLAAAVTASSASAADWPDNPRLSGNAFLTPGLLALQQDPGSSPISLWLDRGLALWSDTSRGASCQSCHGGIESLKKSAPSFPRLSSDGRQLINLEDQIVACRSRSGAPKDKLEDDAVLALSAALHQAAKGQSMAVQPLPRQSAQWQARLGHGAQLFATRMGRMNLACVHCHEQNVGRQMRADVISPGHPTGFPIYRTSWQTLGSIDRRLRACYSGVQAQIPPAGDPALRDLELYLKVRASGMPLDGPSIRR
jgi:sulfur-oxidizing protein SoxA